MARHGDGELYTCGIDARPDLLQSVSRADSFVFAAVQTVFVFEERLPNWVRE
jgi:hypothetical protein